MYHTSCKKKFSRISLSLLSHLCCISPFVSWVSFWSIFSLHFPPLSPVSLKLSFLHPDHQQWFLMQERPFHNRCALLFWTAPEKQQMSAPLLMMISSSHLILWILHSRSQCRKSKCERVRGDLKCLRTTECFVTVCRNILSVHFLPYHMLSFDRGCKQSCLPPEGMMGFKQTGFPHNLSSLLRFGGQALEKLISGDHGSGRHGHACPSSTKPPVTSFPATLLHKGLHRLHHSGRTPSTTFISQHLQSSFDGIKWSREQSGNTSCTCSTQSLHSHHHCRAWSSSLYLTAAVAASVSQVHPDRSLRDAVGRPPESIGGGIGDDGHTKPSVKTSESIHSHNGLEGIEAACVSGGQASLSSLHHQPLWHHVDGSPHQLSCNGSSESRSAIGNSRGCRLRHAAGFGSERSDAGFGDFQSAHIQSSGRDGAGERGAKTLVQATHSFAAEDVETQSRTGRRGGGGGRRRLHHLLPSLEHHHRV